MKRTVQLYLVIVSIVGLGIFFILHVGSQLPEPVPSVPTHIVSPPTGPTASSLVSSVKSNLSQNGTSPLSRLFLQLFVIIAVGGVVGGFFTRCGQPAVVGEITAGILPGPSLFVVLPLDPFHFVFAASSLDALRLFSQIGVGWFLLPVGSDLYVS